jgi:general secretion pathway protein I
MSGQDATRGITLLELVVAVLVLALATVAALRSTEHATRALGGETARVLALQVALNRAEEYRLYGARVAAGLPRDLREGPVLWRLDVTEEPTRAGHVLATIGARAEAGPGARIAVIAPREVAL